MYLVCGTRKALLIYLGNNYITGTIIIPLRQAYEAAALKMPE
jgi:hypothetical protein